MAVAGRPGILRRLPKRPGSTPSGVPARRTARRGHRRRARRAPRRRSGAARRRRPRTGRSRCRRRSPRARRGDRHRRRHRRAVGARLQQLAPPDGPVLVTGAGGGVGGFAVALLAASGFEVIASTGRADELGEHLRALGAAEVVAAAGDRARAAPAVARWSAVVDSVGGAPLVNAIAQTAPGGVVTACGLAASPDLPGDGAAVHPPRRHARGHRLRRHLPRDAARRPGPCSPSGARSASSTG